MPLQFSMPRQRSADIVWLLQPGGIKVRRHLVMVPYDMVPFLYLLACPCQTWVPAFDPHGQQLEVSRSDPSFRLDDEEVALGV